MDRTKPLILLADDSDDFREVVATKLMASGFDVAEAKNGAEAVEKAHDLRPDLILMDIQMPGELNGIDAAFKIKEDPEEKDTKIAFLSGMENPWPAFSGERTAVSKQIGMEDFILKTEDLDVVLEKVMGFLSAPVAAAAPAEGATGAATEEIPVAAEHAPEIPIPPAPPEGPPAPPAAE